jgi:hypothetical protein
LAAAINQNADHVAMNPKDDALALPVEVPRTVPGLEAFAWRAA